MSHEPPPLTIAFCSKITDKYPICILTDNLLYLWTNTPSETDYLVPVWSTVSSDNYVISSIKYRNFKKVNDVQQQK